EWQPQHRFPRQVKEPGALACDSLSHSTPQDKLEQGEFRKVSTQEQRGEIASKLSQASSWLEDEGYAATTKELKEKLSELRKLCKALFFKVEERRKWPDRLAALDSLLNHSSIFLK
ncbi:hypothetical protein FKM82_029615, partial [Ascaphus truei]